MSDMVVTDTRLEALQTDPENITIAEGARLIGGVPAAVSITQSVIALQDRLGRPFTLREVVEAAMADPESALGKNVIDMAPAEAAMAHYEWRAAYVLRSIVVRIPERAISVKMVVPVSAKSGWHESEGFTLTARTTHDHSKAMAVRAFTDLKAWYNRYHVWRNYAAFRSVEPLMASIADLVKDGGFPAPVELPPPESPSEFDPPSGN